MRVTAKVELNSGGIRKYGDWIYDITLNVNATTAKLISVQLAAATEVVSGQYNVSGGLAGFSVGSVQYIK